MKVMYNCAGIILLFVGGLVMTAVQAHPAELVLSEVQSDLVPSPIEYAVLLPDDYNNGQNKFPLMFFLHGGGGDRGFLAKLKPVFEEAWQSGLLPPVVVVTPSVAKRCFYMDFKDGSQKWATFIKTDLLAHIRANYNVHHSREKTILSGISMGGMGSLRLLFKNPDIFSAAVALEPGIEPALRWKDVKMRNKWWRDDQLLSTAYGQPIDNEYWEANNPASIAQNNAEKLRNANIHIYIECGDRDVFYLHEGTEYLHRILYDHKILHEYPLVRGADHLGQTLRNRFLDAFAFIHRLMNPPVPETDPRLEKIYTWRKMVLGE